MYRHGVFSAAQALEKSIRGSVEFRSVKKFLKIIFPDVYGAPAGLASSVRRWKIQIRSERGGAESPPGDPHRTEPPLRYYVVSPHASVHGYSRCVYPYPYDQMTERCHSLQTAFRVSTTVRKDMGEREVDPAKQPQKYNGLQGTNQLATGSWAAKSFSLVEMEGEEPRFCKCKLWRLRW
ncbi:hypothetical protein CTAM01_14221 [Colletotrichum tamarilloi]|uniref:Uncharacterized protein n=1 Tax=Colletotrichum tamarilloi TaxID=1209934 RepID=A0ABQ9QPU9_9PEZI|nr:uncharacterized protein CTAM01_14221 [Colletotrichum tamarilloi]KAK1480762.1 hypothetical protein CTAM01_14221 [Colletotrichum tamarilloi]